MTSSFRPDIDSTPRRLAERRAAAKPSRAAKIRKLEPTAEPRQNGLHGRMAAEILTSIPARELWQLKPPEGCNSSSRGRCLDDDILPYRVLRTNSLSDQPPRRNDRGFAMRPSPIRLWLRSLFDVSSFPDATSSRRHVGGLPVWGQRNL
ncbi:hypothetical protein VTN31DRAFT_4136 [Thermomyces dupontii]|uniref:uncharacterized protein n=1 Tax=Talaromyces thermophilus TaxID=28565 RepID=UPI0037439062